MIAQKENTVLKTTFIITFIIILSKIAGFVREIFLSAAFGQSMLSDAYTMSLTMLNIISLIFLVGISSTFIPIYTKARLKFGDESAHLYASNILNLYIVMALLVSILGFIFAPQIVGLFWHGDVATQELIVQLSRIMYPSLIFYAISGVLVNILNARKNFVPEQLMGFAISFCVILACLLFKNIVAVTVATAISAFMQVVILLPFLRKNFKYKRALNLKNKDLQRTFKLAVPSLISIAFDELNNMTDKIFASAMGMGVVSALKYSFTLVQTALGILVVPITTIMFSELSGYAANQQMPQLKSTVIKSLEIVALITLPIILIAVICSREIIGIVYQRGQFSVEDTLYTAPIFTLYIIGIFAFGFRNFLTRVFYSLQLTKIPMIIGITTVCINILLDFILKDILGARGLTLATSISGLCGALIMIITLRKKLGYMGIKKSAVQFIKIFICAGISAIAVIIAHNFLIIKFSETNFSSYLSIFLICAVIGLVLYALLAVLFKVNTAFSIIDIVKKKLHRKKS